MVDAYRVWQFELVQLFSSLVSGWHGDACFWNNLIKVLLKKAACRLTNKQSLFNLKKASAILPLMDRHAHFYRLTDMRVRFSKPTDMTICPYRPTHMRTYSSNQEWASEEITFVYILIWHTLFKVALEFHVTEKKCRSAKIVKRSIKRLRWVGSRAWNNGEFRKIHVPSLLTFYF